MATPLWQQRTLFWSAHRKMVQKVPLFATRNFPFPSSSDVSLVDTLATNALARRAGGDRSQPLILQISLHTSSSAYAVRLLCLFEGPLRGAP